MRIKRDSEKFETCKTLLRRVFYEILHLCNDYEQEI